MKTYINKELFTISMGGNVGIGMRSEETNVGQAGKWTHIKVKDRSGYISRLHIIIQENKVLVRYPKYATRSTTASNVLESLLQYLRWLGEEFAANTIQFSSEGGDLVTELKSLELVGYTEEVYLLKDCTFLIVENKCVSPSALLHVSNLEDK